MSGAVPLTHQSTRGRCRAEPARGDTFRRPDVLIRTGDTPQKDRNRFARESADLLITTPEWLYLLLTSNAREALRGIETERGRALEPLGENDGRVALYLTDDLPKLYRPPALDLSGLPEKQRRLFEHLRTHGASFFPALQQAAGGGFPQETLDALWALVWRGLVTNDGFFALRAATQPAGQRVRRAWAEGRASFRSRRHTPHHAAHRGRPLEPRHLTLRSSRRHLDDRVGAIAERACSSKRSTACRPMTPCSPTRSPEPASREHPSGSRCAEHG